MRLRCREGIQVETGETGDAKGYAEAKGTHIVLSRALGAAERAAVLVHELAHCLLHFGESHWPNLKQRELEAEATAYVVAHHFGLELESNFYLASYGVKADDLLESLPVIQKTAHEIIQAVAPDERREPAALAAQTELEEAHDVHSEPATNSKGAGLQESYPRRPAPFAHSLPPEWHSGRAPKH